MGKKRIQIDLSEGDYEALRRLAEGRTLAEVFRHALKLETYLAGREKAGAKVIIREEGQPERELASI